MTGKLPSWNNAPDFKYGHPLPPVELIAKGLEIAASLLEEAPVASKLLADTSFSARIASAGSETAASVFAVGPRKLNAYAEATEFLGMAKIGGSHPFFAEASNGERWVLKYLRNRQGDPILANEWLGHPVQRYMGIESPDVAIINISPDFIKSAELTNPAFAELMVKPGPAFASKVVENAVSPGNDANIVNLRDFGKTLVSDAFLFNFDGAQPVFDAVKASGKGALGKSSGIYRAHMVDNGLAFFGENNDPSWVTKSTWRPTLYGSGYYDFLSKGDIAFDVQRLQNMPDAVIRDQMRSLPSQWVSNPSSLKRAVDLVLQGKDSLPTVMERTINSNPQYFPLVR